MRVTEWKRMVAWNRYVVLVVTKPRRWKKTEGNKSQKRAPRLYKLIPESFFGNNLPRRPEMVRLAVICVQIEDHRRLMLKLFSWWNFASDSWRKLSIGLWMMVAGSRQVSYLFMIWYIARWLAACWNCGYSKNGGCCLCVTEMAAGPAKILIFYCVVW